MSFSRKTAMIFSFFSLLSLSLCSNTFGFSHFHFLFGETCQLQQPSLVHLTFKLMLHFFSDILVLCKHTHCPPFSLEYCEVEQMGFKTNCHLHLIHSAHCYIKESSYILLFCLKLPVIMFFLFTLLFPSLPQCNIEEKKQKKKKKNILLLAKVSCIFL